MAFVVYYGFVLHGGDTLTYWKDSKPLFNAFLDNPLRYFQILWEGDPQAVNTDLLNEMTGHFAGRTFARVSSFVTIKVTSIFYILGLGSYLAGTLMTVFLSTFVHWKLYVLFRDQLKVNLKRFTLLFLFLPSFPFWCAGVSKDTWMTLIVLGLIFMIFDIVYHKRRYVLYALIGLFLIYIGIRIRGTIVYLTLMTAMMAYATYLLNKIDINYIKNTLKGLMYLTTFAGVVFFMTMQGADEALESSESFSEAIVKQKDFTENKTYGDNKYSLGFTSYSSTELVLKSPIVIISGIFRPFIWEALSVSLIINGIESVVFFFFTYKFTLKRIRFGWFKNQEQITGNFSLLFSIFLGFVAGFISILYGVLVRFRAPLLPFYGLLLSLKSENEDL